MKLKPFIPKAYQKLTTSGKKEGVNRNHIILGFFGFDFSPEVITRLLALKPFSIGLKGEEYWLAGGKVKKIREESHWQYEWKIYSSDYIGVHLSKFIREVIGPNTDKIKAINQTCETLLTVVQYYYTGWNPGLGFEAEEMKILADINASVDIDIYALAEEEK